MPRGHPVHAGQRAIADITVRATRAAQQRKAWRDETGMAETDQQYQLVVTGTATSQLAAASIDITFDFPFHYAPGQRDSDLEYPHFTFGSEVDEAVSLTAGVKTWATSADTGAVIGCTLWVFALSGTDSETAFSGKLHATFQGFSSNDDDPGTSES